MAALGLLVCVTRFVLGVAVHALILLGLLQGLGEPSLPFLLKGLVPVLDDPLCLFQRDGTVYHVLQDVRVAVEGNVHPLIAALRLTLKSMRRHAQALIAALRLLVADVCPLEAVAARADPPLYVVASLMD